MTALLVTLLVFLIVALPAFGIGYRVGAASRRVRGITLDGPRKGGYR